MCMRTRSPRHSPRHAGRPSQEGNSRQRQPVTTVPQLGRAALTLAPERRRGPFPPPPARQIPMPPRPERRFSHRLELPFGRVVTERRPLSDSRHPAALSQAPPIIWAELLSQRGVHLGDLQAIVGLGRQQDGRPVESLYCFRRGSGADSVFTIATPRQLAELQAATWHGLDTRPLQARLLQMRNGGVQQQTVGEGHWLFRDDGAYITPKHPLRPGESVVRPLAPAWAVSFDMQPDGECLVRDLDTLQGASIEMVRRQAYPAMLGEAAVRAELQSPPHLAYAEPADPWGGQNLPYYHLGILVDPTLQPGQRR